MMCGGFRWQRASTPYEQTHTRKECIVKWFGSSAARTPELWFVFAFFNDLRLLRCCCCCCCCCCCYCRSNTVETRAIIARPLRSSLKISLASLVRCLRSPWPPLARVVWTMFVLIVVCLQKHSLVTVRYWLWFSEYIFAGRTNSSSNSSFKMLPHYVWPTKYQLVVPPAVRSDGT